MIDLQHKKNRKAFHGNVVRIIKFIGIAILLTTVNTIQSAIQVIPAPKNGSGEIGRGLGEGFSRGMEQGMALGLKERERKKQEKENAQKLAREKKILENILKGYEPSKHEKYILQILQSDLSNETKKMVTQILNEEHKIYLEEQKKGFWPWSRR